MCLRGLVIYLSSFNQFNRRTEKDLNDILTYVDVMKPLVSIFTFTRHTKKVDSSYEKFSQNFCKSINITLYGCIFDFLLICEFNTSKEV